MVDILLRGTLNLRRSARWLIKYHGWETSEEAVVSALRRYAETSAGISFADRQEQLADTRVDVFGSLALVTIPRTAEIRQQALETWWETDPMGPLGVLPGRTTARLLVDERAVNGLARSLGPHTLHDVTAPVSAIRLHSDTASDQLSLAIEVLMALSHRDIIPLETISCTPEYLVLIQGKETLDAHTLITDLIEDAQPVSSS